MKKEETIEEMFRGKAMIPRLQGIGIYTLKQLHRKCIDKDGFYIPIKFPNPDAYDKHERNYFIAKALSERGLISEIEVAKQQPLLCYIHIVKKRALRAFFFHEMRTIGALAKKCIEDGVFVPMKGKKIGRRANYEAGILLQHVGLLSEEAFLKVPMPHWKARLLTDREIGEDGNRLIAEMEWSKQAKEMVTHAVSQKFPTVCGGKRSWNDITLGEVVKTFVRINSSEIPVLYTKGHIGSHWYTAEWFNKKFDDAFVEVKEKLEDLGFLFPNTEIV
jgi:hypothetical protein